MKLTKAQINQIIEEEMRAVLKEGVLGTFKGAFPPLGNANAFVKRFAGKGVHDTTIMESDLWSFFSALDRVTNEKVRKEIIELTGWQFERLNLMRGYVGRTMTLPKSIGYFSNIEEMVIAGHSFKTIPDSFENLVNLKKLNLANNEIEKLPWFLVKHPSLKKVELIGNPIRKELVEKRSEWLKQFEPKKKGLPQDPLGWGAMGEWLQDVDYWTTKGRDLMEDELPANFWEKIAEPEEKKAAEEEAEQIKLRTTKEREPIDYKEMEKQAEEELDAFLKKTKEELSANLKRIREKAGIKDKPKRKEKSEEVREKIADLEIKAQEIAQKIAEKAFHSKDVLMIAAMGFTKRQAQGLAIGVVPEELEDKDIMKMAIEGLLNAEKGELGAGYAYDFNPVDDDPPARELDIMYLLRKSLKQGRQYKGRDLKIEDGEFGTWLTSAKELKWHKLEIGTTGHSYLHRRKFDETKWDWVDMSKEKFDQKLYDSFLKAKAAIQIKKLKEIDDSQWVGREKHWRPSGFGMLLTLGSIYQDHQGLYFVRTEVDEKGWKESSRMNYDKENEQWDVKSFKHDEGYDKRKNLEWTLRRSHWWLDEKIDDDASWEHDGNVFWRFSYKDGVDESSGGHRWTEYYEITYSTTWRGPLKGWDKVHKSSEYLYTDDEDDHYY